MPIECKYNCGRTLDIDFLESDNCLNIDTAQRYNLILISRGSLTLHINSQVFTFVSPCVVILKEDLTISFIASHMLSAKTIKFDVTFLNVNITYDLINSKQYEKAIEAYGFIPLNVFYEKTDRFSYLLPLSKAMHMNRTTISKCFKEIVGHSVTEYIIRYRIQSSLHSLSTTEIRVAEIAMECGFSSTAYFIKQFKTRMGITPLEFRKRIVNKRKAERNNSGISKWS